MEIEHLIKTLSRAVQQSHTIAEVSAMNSFLDRYFDVKNSGESETYVPKTIRIELPHDEDEEGKVILAPTAALVKHNNMNIDYVKLNLNIGVEDETDNGLCVTSQNLGDKNEQKKDGELEIMFKCTDKPEGIARVETNLNGIL